jgi:type I restriction enzyme S subunit
LNRNTAYSIPIKIPQKQEQQKIASILSALDDKIELNHEMNRTLEAMAQAIFKHWFVDFEFPNEEGQPYKSSGGEMVYSEELQKEIPKGWGVGTVGDLCKRITNGGTPRRMESRFWDEGTIPWFKTGELLDGVLLDSEEKITQAGLENSSCHLLPINTVIVALYASPTVGRLGLLKVSATTNQACSALEAKDEIGYAYIFHVLLSNREYLNNVAVGSAQQNISQAIIRDLNTIIPLKPILEEFQRLVDPMYNQMTNDELESKDLTKIRDLLLPKLLSGVIRVNSIAGNRNAQKEAPA